ncbi:diguanylate cyclase [Thermodesulfobacterium hveragerdense]|uniref:diguanylate cyclase n=1 Tax=Thermodesulfobacterium hveragerdense TaxID=53424 RepID=UPI0004031979|nr:diguanylate cyclase [Thermodesulfobacterium hveragerdense]
MVIGKVLVILPVTFLRKLVEDILKNYFHDISLVATVKEALSLIRSGEIPDLIISSYILDDGDVFDLLETLEKEQKIQKVPVLLLTSKEDPELIERALKKGVLEVILKKDIPKKLPKFLKDFIKIIELQNLEGNILYVEDTNLYIKFLSHILEHTKLKVLSFQTVEEALKAFEQNEIDLVITDYILGGGDSGLDLIRSIRENDTREDIPIIVLTGYDTPARRIELFKAGADDYIPKPPLKEEILIKIFNHVTKKKVLDRLKKKLKELESLYIKDPLTGLYNRNVIEDFLLKEFEKAKRHKYDIGFIMADLDKFKEINDKFGHLTGDKVIKIFAQIILNNIRTIDYGIRYGGEEFLIVCPHMDYQKAISKAEEMRKEIEKTDVDGIKITASFGVTSLDLHPDKSLEELIGIADQALYTAKASGRNTVKFL